VKRIPLAEHPNKRKLKSRQPHCAVYENELQRVWPTPGTTQRLPGNFFLFQHSYLAAYDFDSARKFCCTADYENTNLEKVAREATRRHAHQSDPAAKLAREVDQPPACDNGLVPDQKEHRDRTLAVWKVPPGASYGNALKADL